MTLIEKFLPKMYCYFGSGMLTNAYDENVALQNAKECEQIADDYAIRFLEFIHVNCEEDWGSDNYLYDEESYTIRELLEIFKKERNL